MRGKLRDPNEFDLVNYFLRVYNLPREEKIRLYNHSSSRLIEAGYEPWERKLNYFRREILYDTGFQDAVNISRQDIAFFEDDFLLALTYFYAEQLEEAELAEF